MTKQSTLRQKLEALLQDQQSKLAQAFFKVVEGLRDNVDLARVIAFLERGDIEGAIDAMRLDAAAYRLFGQAIEGAYVAAGATTAALLPAVPASTGGKVIVRFTERNPRAEMELARQSSEFVTRTTADQRAGLRRGLSDGLAAGRNPKQTALDVIGRIDPATRKRVGGLIGLTDVQSEYITNARNELLNLDPSYFNRKRRDKRFDSAIRKAFKAGKPLNRDKLEEVIARYSDRMLQLRAETIARTETMQALNSAQVEAWRQMLDQGDVRADEIEKVWRATRDSKTRDSHRALNGVAVGINEIFSNGMKHPGDPAGGVGQIVNCRCTMFLRLKKKDDR